MALEIMATRVALETTTAPNTQTIRIADMSETPVAVIAITTRATSGGEHPDDAQICIGFACDDGGGTPRSFCTGTSADDASAASYTLRYQSNTDLGTGATPSATSQQFSFKLNSFLADVGSGAGLSIDIDDEPASGWYVTFILFGGSDIANVWVGVHDDLDTTSATNVQCGDGGATLTDFQADTVFAANTMWASAWGAFDIQGLGALQFGVWDAASAAQHSCLHSSQNGQATTVCSNYHGTDFLIGQYIYNDAGTFEGVASTHANGFTMTPSADAGLDTFCFLAIEWASAPSIGIVSSALPSSAVDWEESGFAFAPDFGMSCFVGTTTNDTNDKTGSDVAKFSIHTFQSGQAYSMGIGDDDNQGDSITSTWSTDDFYIGDFDSVNGADSNGALSSMDADGWTVGLAAGTHDSVARVGWSIAFKAAAAGAQYRRRQIGFYYG